MDCILEERAPILLFFSGIITLLAYLIIIYFAVRYSLEFIKKKNPTAYYVNRQIEDAGIYNFNSTSFFHYIYLTTKRERELVDFDFDSFRIIGFNTKGFQSFLSAHPLKYENAEHWIYGKCDVGTDVKEEDIKDLIKIKDFSKAACLRKYYDKETKTYYDINDKNFVSPQLAHGMSNFNYSFYAIIIERCKDDNLRKLSGLGQCNNKEAIEDSIKSSLLNMDFIDYYPDVLNYNHPFKKYFYSMNSVLYTNSFISNDLSFNPTLLKTNYGIVFDRSKIKYTYMFDQLIKVVNNEEYELVDDEGKKMYDDDGKIKTISSGFVSVINFYMENRLQHYERTYIKLQDLLSKIGGFGKTTFIITSTINVLICRFITLLDTEDFILSLNTNINNTNEDTMCNAIKKDTNENRQIIYNLKNPNLYENNLSNKYLDQKLQGNEILKIKQNDKDNKKSITNIKDGPIPNNSEYNKNITNSIKTSYQQTEEFSNKPTKKCNFCWFQYLWYMFYCGVSNKNIAYYENLRQRILSEENIIISHYNLYTLISILGLDNNEELILDKKYITIF